MSRTRSTVRYLPALLLFAASVATGGCGFVVVHGPPSDHLERESLSCTTSNVGPILDAVAAGAYLVFAIEGFSSGFENSSEIGLGSLAYAGLHTASFGVGMSKTHGCREAEEALAERRERQDSPRADPEVGH